MPHTPLLSQIGHLAAAALHPRWDFINIVQVTQRPVSRRVTEVLPLVWLLVADCSEEHGGGRGRSQRVPELCQQRRQRFYQAKHTHMESIKLKSVRFGCHSYLILARHINSPSCAFLVNLRHVCPQQNLFIPFLFKGPSSSYFSFPPFHWPYFTALEWFRILAHQRGCACSSRSVCGLRDKQGSCRHQRPRSYP